MSDLREEFCGIVTGEYLQPHAEIKTIDIWKLHQGKLNVAFLIPSQHGGHQLRLTYSGIGRGIVVSGARLLVRH
jgi:hypothetical protein